MIAPVYFAIALLASTGLALPVESQDDKREPLDFGNLNLDIFNAGVDHSFDLPPEGKREPLDFGKLNLDIFNAGVDHSFDLPPEGKREPLNFGKLNLGIFTAGVKHSTGPIPIGEVEIAERKRALNFGRLGLGSFGPLVPTKKEVAGAKFNVGDPTIPPEATALP